MTKVTVFAYPSIAPEGHDFQNVKGDVARSKANKARSATLALAMGKLLALLLPADDPKLDELTNFRCKTTPEQGMDVVLDSEMYNCTTTALAARALNKSQYRAVYDQAEKIINDAELTGILLPKKPEEDGEEVALQFSVRNPAESVDPPFWTDVVYRKVDSIIECIIIGGLFPTGDASGNPLYVGVDGFVGGARIGVSLHIKIG